VSGPIICIGEVLFDVFGGVSLLAGAPLNAAAHLSRMGHDIRFVSRVGMDEAGSRALKGIEELGISTRWISCGSEPTGRVDVVLSEGEPSYNIWRNVAYEQIVLSQPEKQELSQAAPAWAYFGTLAQAGKQTRETTSELLSLLPGTRRFYDVNLRKGFEDPTLVMTLLEYATVVKLNHVELAWVASICGWPITTEMKWAASLCEHFQLEALCITRGERGAALLHEGTFYEDPAPVVTVLDTVGAGDAFAAALLHGLCEKWLPEEMLRFGNRLGSYVATQRGAIPELNVDDYREMQDVQEHR